MVQLAKCIVLFFIADMTLIASGFVNNSQIEARNGLEGQKTRRKGKSRSTSSSSGARDSKESGDRDSLDLSSLSSLTSSDSKRKKHDRPKSSAERKGWRKWHRKCTPCPEDMRKKWRDPTLNWICGAYQRARRSFKSLCMMHYRNCQDGTMFIKIHEHRCANSSKVSPHGDHFFYEYKAVLPDDSSDSESESATTTGESSSD